MRVNIFVFNYYIINSVYYSPTPSTGLASADPDDFEFVLAINLFPTKPVTIHLHKRSAL